MELKIIFVGFITFLFELSVVTSTRNNFDSKKESRLKNSKLAGNRVDVFENLLQVYDPSFLAVLWPKISNGVHLSIDVSCWEDMRDMFKDLSDGQLWAFKGKK